MVRQDNPKDVIANGAVAYIINRLQTALSDFREELDLDNKLDATYISARDGSAKANADDAIRMLRWLYEIEFSLTPPSPLSDAEVDAINPGIRTFEDGT